MARDYETIGAILNDSGDRTQRMRTFVDAAWDSLSTCGVSWVGFYLHEGADELVLGPRRDTPACSPIGLHGACGQAFLQKRPLVVRDVKALGENYVACDPRDQSELVIPLFEDGGKCWGVLDLDSHSTAAFDQADVEAMLALLRKSGLTAKDAPLGDTLMC